MGQNFNSFTITGNLGKDAERKFTQSGKPYLQFSVANQRPSYNGQTGTTDWFPVRLYGEKRVDAIQQYLVKGKSVLVSGRLETWRKEDDSGSGITLVANELEFLGGGGRSDAGSPGNDDDSSQAPTADEDEFPF